MPPECEERANVRLFLSLIVPIYNEADTVQQFLNRVLPILHATAQEFEIIFVNDGSSDNTLEYLVEMCESRREVKALNLSRNFGKEVALSAGIEHAQGNAIVLLDVDLQDPPELIPELVARWREGFDNVIAVRNDRRAEGWLKRTWAALFYWVLGHVSDTRIPPNAGDFRLLDESVASALRQMPERTRFMKGLYAWVGFRTAQVEYTRSERVAGQSKYRFRRLWHLAMDGIFSFSTVPLRIWTWLGFTAALIAGIYGSFIIGRTLLFGVDVPGYASLLVAVLFLSGLNMIGLGILGEYLGRIFVEVKQRPMYLVASRIGFDKNSQR